MPGTRADGVFAPAGGGPAEIDDLDGGDDARSPLSGDVEVRLQTASGNARPGSVRTQRHAQEEAARRGTCPTS